MATVTGFTAERMLVIENETVVDGEVVGDNLHLIRRDLVVIDAGNVRGATGATGSQGPPGTNGTNGKDGLGVPVGGSIGQLLGKNSSADNDTHWVDPYSLPASIPRGLQGRKFRGPASPYSGGGGTYWTTPAMPVTAGREYLMQHYFYILNGSTQGGFMYVTVIDSMGVLTGDRLFWIHTPFVAGGTWANNIVRQWTAPSTGNVTFTFGSNGPSPASPNVNTNVCQMSLTDIGGV